MCPPFSQNSCLLGGEVDDLRGRVPTWHLLVHVIRGLGDVAHLAYGNHYLFYDPHLLTRGVLNAKNRTFPVHRRVCGSVQLIEPRQHGREAGPSAKAPDSGSGEAAYPEEVHAHSKLRFTVTGKGAGRVKKE